MGLILFKDSNEHNTRSKGKKKKEEKFIIWTI